MSFSIAFTTNNVNTEKDYVSPVFKTEAVDNATYNHQSPKWFAGQYSYSLSHSSFQNEILTIAYSPYILFTHTHTHTSYVHTSSHLG